MIEQEPNGKLNNYPINELAVIGSQRWSSEKTVLLGAAATVVGVLVGSLFGENLFAGYPFKALAADPTLAKATIDFVAGIGVGFLPLAIKS